ncbi:peptidoglycan-binding protein LysM [Pseudoxanthomonas kalamensis DSM 18571]|uniref:FecR family protein n=1 Tax=Pseudoxanthomonas kalamensis TaxID=289483 RepID=UPI001391F3EA|nr:FecR domain-containing protein [Pseudoxanthomonas kalamensis]KAF1710350.1 peptidoglycan-binding protein LysM [Pseudoxanthomonas kalamensis DSM 18571]
MAGRSRWQWWLGVLLVLSGIATPLSAQDWNYRVRPGDTLWDLSGEYLKPGIGWRQLQSHNDIANPYHLPPGLILHIPLSWLLAQPANARVVAVHGEATVQTPDQDSAVPARQGAELGVGTMIRTAADASLTLEFADGSRLLLEGGSELRLDRLSRYGKHGIMADTRVRLQRGGVSNEIKPARGAAPNFIVDTPSSSSAVRGTHFRMRAEPELSHTEVTEGGVEVDSGTHAALVPHGFGVRVATGQDGPVEPVRLLPAPDLSSVPGTLHRARARLQWPAVEGASGYRVQVSAQPGFDSLAADAQSARPQIELPALADGDYHLLARAIDGNGLEGMDARLSFRLEALPEPPFVLAPADDATVRGTHPDFRWTQSEHADSYLLEVGDTPDFEQALARAETAAAEVQLADPLPPGRYYWRIASRDDQGHQGEFGQTQAFELRPVATTGEIETSPADGNDDRVTFQWQAGEPGQRYRFQLSRKSDFSRLKVDEIVEEPRITLPKPGPGTWYLRASVIDSDGYEGPFQPAQSIKNPCRLCELGTGALVLLLVMAL